jgi:hypothetical protein
VFGAEEQVPHGAGNDKEAVGMRSPHSANQKKRTKRMKRLFVATLAAMTMISPAFALSSDLCESLWLQRNAYYKEAGYCFKTSRAIRYFGNAGCLYDAESAVPLSRSIRNRITDIGRVERQLGCGN